MLVANKYKLLEKVGSGGCGSVYKGINIRTNEFVAIKMERISTLLKNEAKIYQYLGRYVGKHVEGIPHIKWYGLYEDKYCIVMNLLGPSLHHYMFQMKKGPMELDEIYAFGRKMVERIHFIHSKDLLHRDIKPENFLLDPTSNNQLYLIDFGFAKLYKRDGKHIPISYGKSMIGSPHFVSMYVHQGIEPSRRDDLESIGYLMLWMFFNGHLPWNNQDHESMLKLKIEIKKMNIPSPLKQFILFCRIIEFDETPDYSFLTQFLISG